MGNIAERLSEARRLAILTVLDQCPSREASDSLIAIALKDSACACSYDAVRSELAWLRDAGLIAIGEISCIMIAKLKRSRRRCGGRGGDNSGRGAAGTEAMKRSKVSRLPREMREQIERLWREGCFTLDELQAWLHEQLRENPNAMPSRTALGRYLAKYRVSFQKIQEAQAIAGRCVEQLGENPKGEVSRLLVQLLEVLALQSLNQLQSETEPLGSRELMFLSAAIRNLATAEKTATDREIKIRKEVLANLKAGLIAKARTGGLSRQTAAEIRAAIADDFEEILQQHKAPAFASRPHIKAMKRAPA